MTRSPRLTLTGEDLRLWRQVARGVKPLKGRSLADEPDSSGEPDPGGAPVRSAAPIPTATRSRTTPAPPGLAPVEKKTLSALRRGTRTIDAVIDLHGLRQAEAHDRLLAFLRRSQHAGHSLVLVITGKGGAWSGDGPFEERGVLRRVVPHWLRMADVRPFVIGFAAASPRHGGAGALYVRLRRAGRKP